MFHSIYPRLAISRLLDCFYDLLVLSLRVEFFRGQCRDLRVVFDEFPKLVFGMFLSARFQVFQALRGCLLWLHTL